MLIYAAAGLQRRTDLYHASCRLRACACACVVRPYREDPLWVALGPHVGVMDLLQDHPGLVVLPVLEGEDLPTSELALQGLTSRWRDSHITHVITFIITFNTFHLLKFGIHTIHFFFKHPEH